MLNTNYTEELLGLKDIVLENVINSDVFHIHLSMKKKLHMCPKCSQETSKVHDYRLQKIKDIPIHGKPVYIYLRKRRYKCTSCGNAFYESVSFLPKYQRTTNRLWMYVLSELHKPQSMKMLSDSVSLSITSISRILEKLSYGMLSLPEVISIDEFRGNTGNEKFQCIITDPKKKNVLDILPARKSETLYRYFGNFKDRNKVKLVVMDMSSFFRGVMKNLFPKAEIIADKYHVVRQVTWAFENVRQEVQKQFGDARRKYFKRSRKLLLKSKDELNVDELEQVSHMLSLSKKLAKAYFLKDKFYQMMQSESYHEAKKLFSEWMMHAQIANLKEFNKCIDTFTNWDNEILNAFKYGYTNGFTEGCNNKIKVLKRISYGFRNFEHFRLRILHMFA